MFNETSRVLLVATEDHPNLFLLKLAGFIRDCGGFATRNEEMLYGFHPTHVYISCLLGKNRLKSVQLENLYRDKYPNAIIDIGGVGVDIMKKFPFEDTLNTTYPDYSIYPEMDYSYGYTSRGCIRKCSFCVVPKKEGEFKVVAHPALWHYGFKRGPSMSVRGNDTNGFKKIVFTDNNILADREWFFTVTDWCLAQDGGERRKSRVSGIKKTGLLVDFNQGLDVRLMDVEIVKQLAKLRLIDTLKIGFDSLEYTEQVLNAIDMMKEAGILVRSELNVMVYCDGDHDYESALERCMMMKNMGIGSYVMLNQNAKWTQRMKDLKRWSSKKQIYFSTDIGGYENGMKPKDKTGLFDTGGGMDGRMSRWSSAIERLKAYEPKDGYYLAFSGGKDSQCVYHLCKEAGVKFDAHFHNTSVDPPELVKFIKEHYPDVHFDRPEMTMFQLIVEKGMPPTTTIPFCCKYLKERGGVGRVVVTGVRRQESYKRSGRGVLTLNIGEEGVKKPEDEKEIILQNDNSEARRMYEICPLKSQHVLNPIIDWSESNVWEYHKYLGISHCSLYDEGYGRIGCIGCPQQGGKRMIENFERWPKFRKAYVRTFDKMLAKRIERGNPSVNWKTGEEVLNWWCGR